jgi:hypothetical protein
MFTSKLMRETSLDTYAPGLLQRSVEEIVQLGLKVCGIEYVSKKVNFG